MNNFERDLAFSHEAGDDEIFDAFYRSKFSTFGRIVKIAKEPPGEGQRRGIDKRIQYSDGRELLVDEKKRRKVYPDVAIEILDICPQPYTPEQILGGAGKEEGKPGWAFKIWCDYVVYAVMPSKVIYLFPAKLLNQTTRRFWKDWVEQYGVKPAENIGYYTINVPVPVTDLFDALESEMQNNFDGTGTVMPQAIRYYLDPSGDVLFK